ncbi:MAG: MBL fold metallo-hydrolase [Flavobacterium sp.]|jgi:phosphoribosyl 1,2-cyclic phosphate phosphodiesterase|uniref:MBL fold metallo-hydrolase n=1 Tax=Flavobacterium sp. TaxID=239 RepID=UPI0022C8F8E5|nr:MBL fold metallo-hydrolase [Flavobacterium sp.]MCZ8298454.1 MBL fold metallo-hydrolase [Flavobacterium sp.]
MKIHFLGTGTSQGIPVIGSDHPVCLSQDPRDKRLRVSIWVEVEGQSLVVDCGPDFRQQMLSSGCTRIDGLLFTHEHADHTAGLDDIRPFNFQYGPMPVYAESRVIANLRQRYGYIFATENRYPGAPAVHVHPIEADAPFSIGGVTIQPIRVWHGDLPVLGFRIGDFAYLTDVKTIETAELDKLKGLKVLVVNALREAPHDTHFNLQEALDFVNLVQPEQAYLTHISHHMGFHAEREKTLPSSVFLAYDNLVLTLE